MTDSDVDSNEAAEALVRWFDSQDIGPADAMPVMARVMASCIKIIAKDRASQKKGVQLVADTMNEALELLNKPERKWQ